MGKLLLLSILALTIVVPSLAARERSPRLALQKTVAWMLCGICAYVVSVMFIYPRLLD
jgi:hypothetical protein